MPRTTHSEDWWATASPAVVRCTAHYKDGSACRREESAGANVCGQHGALIPAVQAAAATRIRMSADEATAFLLAGMRDPAVDMRERIKIAQDMLDRVGLGATSKLLVGVVTEDPVEELFRKLLATPDALAEPAQIEVAQIEPADPEPDDVVEAELVPEPAAPAHTVSVHESMSSAPPKHLAPTWNEP